MTTTNFSSNSENQNQQKSSGISMVSLFTWISVFAILIMFWTGMSVVYKKDYVPRTIAKIEHREKVFFANHKILQKKFIGFRNSLS